MINYKFIATLFLGIIFQSYAFASLTLSKLNLEEQLKERIEVIAFKADPTALVQVSIKLKKVETNLSFLGMDTQVTPLENGEDLGPESIEEIKARVLSQVEPFPEWLKKEIVEATTIGNVKVSVTYETPQAPMLNMPARMYEVSRDSANNLNQMRFGLWSIAAFTLFGFLSFFFIFKNFTRDIQKTLEKVISEELIPAFTQMTQSTGKSPVVERSNQQEKSNTPSSNFNPGADQKNQVERLSIHSIRSLITDCYWTGLDGYANYLWNLMSLEQRTELSQGHFIDKNYFTYILKQTPMPYEYHTHVWYLNPNTIVDHINQGDLIQFLRKTPSAVKLISPMRYDQIELTLEERLKFLKVTSPTTDMKVSLTPSALRQLPLRLNLRKVSVDDEIFILKHPNVIPNEGRHEIRSLVWLALAPLEYRKSVLGEIDAKQLAEGWLGADETLNSLLEALNDKKKEMLHYYIKNTNPRVDSDIYNYLVDAGLSAPTVKNNDAVKAA